MLRIYQFHLTEFSLSLHLRWLIIITALPS